LSITYFDPLLPGLLALLVIALLLGWRRMGWVRWILATAVLGLFLATWPPFSHLCAYTLEGWYSPGTAYPAETDFDAIVVLAGGSIPPLPWAPEGIIGAGTYVRCQHAAWLYNNVKAVPVLVAGGPIAGPQSPTHASMMRAALLEKGVPDHHIWTETQSTNTHENAQFSVRILREKGIRKAALVTEAYHMPRSVGCMRKQGMDVVPAPTGFIVLLSYAWKDFLPRTRAIVVVDDMIHEWVGLAWYWLAG
jgi:uncharacterized SAM-binding protein YcdF (DUF218 family)